MSMDYVIKIKMDASYDKINIYKILERGALKKFVYYDQVFGELYKDASKINAESAANKIITAYDNKTEGGPAVFTLIDSESDVHLWFYKSESGWLEFCIGSFGLPKKKGYYIDFAYYLRMFLDLCEDFPILEVKAEMF